MDTIKKTVLAILTLTVTILAARYVAIIPDQHSALKGMLYVELVSLGYLLTLKFLSTFDRLRGDLAQEAKEIWRKYLRKHGEDITAETLRKKNITSNASLIFAVMVVGMVVYWIPFAWLRGVIIVITWFALLFLFFRYQVWAGLSTPSDVDEEMKTLDKLRNMKDHFALGHKRLPSGEELVWLVEMEKLGSINLVYQAGARRRIQRGFYYDEIRGTISLIIRPSQSDTKVMPQSKV